MAEHILSLDYSKESDKDRGLFLMNIVYYTNKDSWDFLENKCTYILKINSKFRLELSSLFNGYIEILHSYIISII